MNKLMKSVIVAAIAAFATPAVTTADVPATATQNVPGTMNYQGYLADPSTGTPYTDGIYTLDLRIWNSAANKTGCLWGGRYTVYVKGGYFNIMLGDPNATALTEGVLPTYSNTELWKALWGSSATDTVRYLGVTPYQNSTHVAISSPIEIAPRQQLLSSPFAFRAQHAQYADQAQSAFSVPGNLTVSGTATFNGAVNMPSGSSVGPLVASSSQVKLTGNTAAANTQPNVYDVGKNLYFYSYANMYFAPTAGNMQFTVPSGYKMNVTGAGTFKSDASVNTIGGDGTTTIGGSGATVVKGSSVNITSTGNSPSSISVGGRSLVLEGGTEIYGRGPLFWNDKGANSGVKPFVLKTVTVTINANSNSTNVPLTETDTYSWSVAGWTEGSGYLYQSTNRLRSLDCSEAGGVKVLSVALYSNATSTVKINVQLMGVHKHFVDDRR